MFGHQSQDDNQNNDITTAPELGSRQMATNDPQASSASTGATAPPTLTPDPLMDNFGSVENKDVLSPAGGYPKPPSQKIHAGGEEEAAPPTPPPALPAATTRPINDDLVTIRQQVITELFPLIDQLDQPPDERYRTLMMMIQATDNQQLIKAAYEAAHNITDIKTKAQALLDIINEINYFTQSKN